MRQFTSSPPPHPAHRLLRIFLYVALLVSAGVTFFFNGHLWEAARNDTLPVWAPLAAPACFTVFVCVYAFDRWFLVRKQAYPVSRAFSQMILAVLFGMFLLPEQTQEFRETKNSRTPVEAARALLMHNDAQVRVSACHLLKHHAHGPIRGMLQKLSTEDPSEEVRKACSF
jgi:hypothetical protein